MRGTAGYSLSAALERNLIITGVLPHRLGVGPAGARLQGSRLDGLPRGHGTGPELFVPPICPVFFEAKDDLRFSGGVNLLSWKSRLVSVGKCSRAGGGHFQDVQVRQEVLIMRL